MQMVTVDRQPIELDLVRQHRLGRYFEVYFNVCGVTDRYVYENASSNWGELWH